MSANLSYPEALKDRLADLRQGLFHDLQNHRHTLALCCADSVSEGADSFVHARQYARRVKHDDELLKLLDLFGMYGG